MRNKKGFTLIELLIVIAIIGLLATLAIISLTTAQRKARDTKRVADIKSIQSAVELYYSDNAAYPEPLDWDEMETLLSPYLTQLPVAPNHDTEEYTYLANDGIDHDDDSTEYVVSATFEDVDHQALSQADDTNYTAILWANAEGVESAGGNPVILDCSAAGVYCLSE